ncbi:MAG: hypothetical protein AAGH57_00190 [Pseudomonadota bacterium]
MAMTTSDLDHGLGSPDDKGVSNRVGSDRLETETDYATNLVLAGIVLRHASGLFQQSVERRLQRRRSNSVADPQASRDGAALIRSMTLLGANRIAARSPLGLGLIAGGLALKVLYDRGKARAAREAVATAQSPPES